MTCCTQTRMTLLAIIAASRDGIDYQVPQRILDTHNPDNPCEACSKALDELAYIRAQVLPCAAVEPIIEAAARLLGEGMKEPQQAPEPYQDPCEQWSPCPGCGHRPRVRCGAGCIGEYHCGTATCRTPPFIRTEQQWEEHVVNHAVTDPEC